MGNLQKILVYFACPLGWINRDIVDAQFPVQVVAGGIAGHAKLTDGVAIFDHVANFDVCKTV